MTRPLAVVLAVVFVLAVTLFGALGWLTHQTLELERAETESRRQAALESRIRLALWRMDSTLTPFLSLESSRPAKSYTTTSTDQWQENPALQRFLTLVQGHFEVAVGEPSGRAFRSLSAHAGPGHRDLQPTFRQRVAALDTATLLEKVEAAPTLEREPRLAEELVQGEVAQEKLAPGIFELSRRELNFQTQMAVFEPAVTIESVLQPLWQGDELLLVRRIRWDREIRLQGSWLDRQALEDWLLGQIRDLLPQATLRPLGTQEPQEARATPEAPGRHLALLPYSLDPGPLPAHAVTTVTSPVQTTLGLAWVAALVTLVAVGVLLGGALQLSARRADFVSAVTHELRTPLTTFRLYTEMLADDMVPPEQRPEYLETLRGEAERLTHLVGNVLAFSRLERGVRPETERLTARELIDRVGPALKARVQAEGVKLHVEIDPELEDGEEVGVITDPEAVERILFNLVDNACKYGRRRDVKHGEEDLDLRLEVRHQHRRRGRGLVLRVRDRGPGILRREAKRIFRPFHRSAQRAAGGVPGVGLGLALSRRLARRLGGDLRWVPSEEGAVFELTIG